MIDITLTPEQEAQAQRMAAIIGRKAQEEALRMARIMASKPDAELVGATEFQIRERAHKLAAHAIETALNVASQKTLSKSRGEPGLGRNWPGGRCENPFAPSRARRGFR
jgi:hypothetical protein